MNYSILWYISWPVLIIVSYRLSLMAVKYFDKKFKEKQAPPDTVK